jgi:hypothetical protein
LSFAAGEERRARVRDVAVGRGGRADAEAEEEGGNGVGRIWTWVWLAADEDEEVFGCERGRRLCNRRGGIWTLRREERKDDIHESFAGHRR